MTNRFAIITASGIGKRFGGEIPKQFVKVKNREIIFHTLDKFIPLLDNKFIIEIVIVVNEKFLDFVTKRIFDLYNEDMLSKIKVIKGGKERYHSVFNGLKYLYYKYQKGLVAVHDGVRPLIPTEYIKEGFNEAEKNGSCVFYFNIEETLRKKENSHYITVPRDLYIKIQTPQIFELSPLYFSLKEGIEEDFKGTDEASFMEKKGYNIYYHLGYKYNIKITTPIDLKLVEFLL